MTHLKSPHADDVFTLLHPAPEKASPILIDSPHSGRIYPEDFTIEVPRDILQASEDRFVDLLVRDTVLHGATVLLADFPRTYIDVNRGIDDIEDHIIANPDDFPLPRNPTVKAMNGIGLIRRTARHQSPMYKSPLDHQNILHRIDHYYRPYHQTISTELKRLHGIFGKALYLDIHSMPSNLAPIIKRGGIMQFINPNAARADFVLSDRDGTTCDFHIRNRVKDFLEKQGYNVTINIPFKGWELIRRYGAPGKGFHALQIEINRSLYLEKNDIEWKDDGGLELKSLIESLTKDLINVFH